MKKLFQESENYAKPQYIHGHMFGGLGVLAGDIRNWTCIPLSIRLHDGLQKVRDLEKSSVCDSSHIIQMIEDAYLAAKTFGNSLLLLDRYFLSVPGLIRLKQLNQAGPVQMEIVTKAKRSCIAFEEPEPKKPGTKGHPAKKGKTVQLMKLFDTRSSEYVTVHGRLRNAHSVMALSVSLFRVPTTFFLISMYFEQLAPTGHLVKHNHLGALP